MRNKAAVSAIQIGLSLLIIVCILAFSAFGPSAGPQTTAQDLAGETEAAAGEEEAIDAFEVAYRNFTAQLKIQEKVDAEILAEFNSGSYSAENPLVVVDPYGLSPLTALAVFHTETPMNVSVHVAGHSPAEALDFQMDGYTTEHMVPIYGLYAGEANAVTLTISEKDGTATNTELSIQTEPLNDAYGSLSIKTYAPLPDQYQPGFTFLLTYSLGAAIDVAGNIRWLFPQREFDLVAFLSTETNTLFSAMGNGTYGKALIVERTLLGRYASVYYSPYGVHHEIGFTENGNLLTACSSASSFKDCLCEIDIHTGEIVHMLDLRTLVQSTRSYISSGSVENDWCHLNAIAWDNGTVLLSSRSQSMLVKLDWPSGELHWIAAEDRGWLPMFRQYLLSPTQPDYVWFYNQHAPEILPDYDNNPDTIDILLFDNGNDRFVYDRELQRAVASGEMAAPENYSRLLHLRINEVDKTIETIWEYGKEYGETLFATYMGDADLLENGNMLGVFNEVSHTDYLEVSANGELVWEADISSLGTVSEYIGYRAERCMIYSDEANQLGIGETVPVFIPEDVLAQYAYAVPS